MLELGNIVLYAGWENDTLYYASKKYKFGENNIDDYEDVDMYLDKVEPNTTVKNKYKTRRRKEKKMKNNLKMKAFTVILMLVMVLTIMPTVNAAEGNYSVGMSLTSSSKLKEGDTVTIKVNLTSVNAGQGIDTITASINYDSNVFEDITTANLTASNEWTPSYAASSKMLTLLKNTKVTSPETVLTITLKVRDVINVESTTVTLKEIVASGDRIIDNGTGDITVSDASVTLSKEQAAVTPTPTPVTPTTPSTNNTIKDNTTTQQTTLPQTGIAQYSVIAIVVVAIIAIASYIAYKKVARDVK